MKSNSIDCDSDLEIQETNCKKRKINEEVIIDSDSDNNTKTNSNTANGLNGHSSNKPDTPSNTPSKKKNVSIVLDDDIEDNNGEVE
jgi:hypothetical protein